MLSMKRCQVFYIYVTFFSTCSLLHSLQACIWLGAKVNKAIRNQCRERLPTNYFATIWKDTDDLPGWTDRTKRDRESTPNHSTSRCHTEPLWTHFDQRTRYARSPVLVNSHLSCFYFAKISSWTRIVENYTHISPDFGKTPPRYWNQHAPQYFSC